MRTVELPRVGILGLSLDLYERVFPRYRERLRGQLESFIAPLRAFCTPVHTALCFTHAEAQAAVRQTQDAAADALLLIPQSYTTSGMIVPCLRSAGLPVILWNTQEAATVTEAYDYDALRMNHVAQGTQDITSVLTREGLRFGMESGHAHDGPALVRLGAWLDAARACAAGRPLRAGLLGSPFAGMDDFQFKHSDLPRLGIEPVTIDREDYVSAWQDAAGAGMEARIARDREQYDCAEDLDDATLHRSARHELALRAVVETHALDAFTMNFAEWTGDRALETLPFLGINKLMGAGLGYAGEGDLLRAAQMAQMRMLGGLATFTEMFTVDYRRQRILMTHMEECNPAWARRDRRVRLVKKTFWASGIEPYAGMVFTLEPGPVTLVSLTSLEGGQPGYVACERRIEDAPPLPRLTMPHWMIALDEPPGDFLTRYSLAGGPHHLVALRGEQLDRLRKLAHLQGVPLREV